MKLLGVTSFRERIQAAVIVIALGALPGAVVARGGGCGLTKVCVTKAQARKLAVAKAKTKLGCPIVLDAVKIQNGDGDSAKVPHFMTRASLDETATKRQRDAGKTGCCYEQHNQCRRGRPLRERAGERVASVVRGSRWS